MKKSIILILLICISFSAIGQNTFRLIEKSKLTISGTSTVHDWTVSANSLEGFITVLENAAKEINFSVIVADINSERGATMDKKMHAALKEEQHPKVLFVLKEFKNEATLLGTLTIAGYSKEVEIPVEFENLNHSIRITGAYPIALSDFEIEPPTAMFGQVVVKNDIKVSFHLIFSE